jgi:hypothetical protein
MCVPANGSFFSKDSIMHFITYLPTPQDNIVANVNKENMLASMSQMPSTLKSPMRLKSRCMLFHLSQPQTTHPECKDGTASVHMGQSRVSHLITGLSLQDGRSIHTISVMVLTGKTLDSAVMTTWAEK